MKSVCGTGLWLVLLLQALCIPQNARAGDSLYVGDWKISGLIDTYYAFDFSRPPTRDRSYTTGLFRHNEFNISLGLVDLKCSSERVHGRVALHTGTYAQANYAAETPTLQRLHEGYAGARLGNSDW